MRTVAGIVDEISALGGSVAKRKGLTGNAIQGNIIEKMANQIVRAISNLEQVDFKAS